MKIKVKIKHLALTVLSFVLFLPVFFYLLQPQYTIYMVKQQMANGEQIGKERIQELLDNGKIFSEQRFALIREYLIEDSYSMEYDVYVGTTSTYWSDPNQAKVKFPFEERLPYLLEYVEEGPIDGYMESAARELADYYNDEGEWQKGDKVLQTALNRGNETYFRSELATKQIDLAVLNGQYELASQYIEEFTANVSEEDTYTKAIVDRIINGLNSGNTVRGKVIVNSNGETPMEGVGVYLRDKNNLNFSIGSEERYQSVTDKNGEYVFKNVPSGSYQLRFGFTFDQIDGFALSMPANPWIEVDDKDVVAQDSLINPLIEIHQPANSEEISEDQLQFSWEPVEGAEYYNISVGREIEGGSVSHDLKSGIKSTELTVPVEDLYFSQGAILFMEDSDWKGIDYSSVLGFADPRGRFFWNVEAYDEKGNLITQSHGYRLGADTFGNLPTFYLKNRELTKADRVLLKNKPEEALEMYKQNYAEDPDDLHSLLMICKIIGVEESVVNKSSKELAIPYLEQLAEKAPNEILFLDILQYYYENEDWQTYKKWYERFEGIKGAILNEYIEGNHAMALLKQEKYEEARSQFRLVMEQGYRHEFIGEWIALELFLGEPLDNAVELAKEHPELGIYDVRIDWELLIKNLQQEEVQFDGYMEELEAVLEWHFKGENKGLEKWSNTTDKIELKRFMEELRK
ncbi:carboxypeptidase-like regulatory domain-containing protein [Sutcliffiella horikoshii]|uniref:hypothetical protein n=1 Tax=Sutcliffiella horikoshii TaxID=79883 RepID=UPI00384CAD4B